ncbi:PREDICTED: uncharacterized protein LOC109472941 [Branchiostoma belcheri]|uniref:Uncharacterized protein LOC109472941 n=1 Tax=Branchiostoma belcheri TaxID=7741 RepID=A0A6P4YGI3_BRABE|nr:PREDICTED: uncharacterized protein LOC109472941 [Branchiostoma belcheri]
MADSKLRYCRLCNGPCDGCSTCLRNSDRFNPSTNTISTNTIKTALEKKGAFTSSEFQTISSDPPEISVRDGDRGTKVDVRLKSMRFIPEYRDPSSPQRKRLEKAARDEIIRSFSLPRGRVRDTDIEVDIREGSVQILIVLNASIIAIAAITIGGLCYADATEKEATKQELKTDQDDLDDPPYYKCRYNTIHVQYERPVPVVRYAPSNSNTAQDIKTVGSGATGAVMGATAGSVLGPVGMGIGAAIGFVGGALFGKHGL